MLRLDEVEPRPNIWRQVKAAGIIGTRCNLVPTCAKLANEKYTKEVISITNLLRSYMSFYLTVLFTFHHIRRIFNACPVHPPPYAEYNH